MATNATTGRGVGRRRRGRRPYRFTADQVLRMVEAGIIPDDQDVELLDGVLYLRTKGELHNAIVDVLAAALRGLVPPGYRVREEKSSTAADAHSLPEPDVMVFHGGPWDFLPKPPPLARMALVVEVNHTTPEDHTAKLARYAAAGVPVYWVVDADERRVAVYTLPGAAGGYDQHVTRRRGESIDVVIDGRACGHVAVEALFPPAP